jgi:hypothetical protein
MVLVSPESSRVVLPPFSTVDLDCYIHAFDFEDSMQPVPGISGAEVLQLYLSNPNLTASLPFSVESNAYGPISVTFTASDSAGNQAAPVSVPVYISSPAAACTVAEVLCESGHCSLQGQCLQIRAIELLSKAGIPMLGRSTDEPDFCPKNCSTNAPSHSCSYVPIVDERPPLVTALGEPPLHVRASGRRSGKIILETSVPVGAQYSDAGAIALDDVDGDVTASLSRAGLSLVSTIAPTTPGLPFVVRYSAHDSSGNVAEPAERHVYVLCVEQSGTCTLDDGTSYCSVSSTECLEPTVREPEAGNGFLLPTVSLIGPPDVEISLGTAYGACNEFTPMSMQCDRGATAHSPIEGDLTWTLMACKEGFAFWQYGLQACDIDTSVVGSHNITFFLVHGNSRVAVRRTLWVLEDCDGA